MTQLLEAVLQLKEVETRVAAAHERRREYEDRFGRSYSGWSMHGPSDSLNASHAGSIRRVKELLQEQADRLAAQYPDLNWRVCIIDNCQPEYFRYGLTQDDGTSELVWAFYIDGPHAATFRPVQHATSRAA